MIDDFEIDIDEFSVDCDKKEDYADPSANYRKQKISKNQLFRAYNEMKLINMLPKSVNPDECWHILTGGEIDSFTFLKWVLTRQDVDYLLLSTWCMAIADINEFAKYKQDGQIKRLDAYVGEIFKGRYMNVFQVLEEVVKPDGRVALFKNHAKVFAGTGSEFDFVITSSANINTNPRTENTTMFFNSEVYKFYKEYYDQVKPFNNGYENWSRYGKDN